MSGLKWHLEMTYLDDIKAGKYGGDVILNTEVENFFALSDVWHYLGFRLKKHPMGYYQIREDRMGNLVEYRLKRRTYENL